jgi:hypothetical protein
MPHTNYILPINQAPLCLLGAKALDSFQWTLTVVALFLNKHIILSEAKYTDRNSLTFFPCKNLLLIGQCINFYETLPKYNVAVVFFSTFLTVQQRLEGR